MFLSPGENADISAAHQHWSPALPRLPRPGFVQGGQPARRSRSPMPQAGNVASPHVPKKAGRSLPAGTEPPSCVMETGRKTSTAKDTNCKNTEGQWVPGQGEGGTSLSLAAGGCSDLSSGKATKWAAILSLVLPKICNRAGCCSSMTNWAWETHCSSSCSAI